MTRLYVSHEHDPADDERLLSSVEMRRRFGDASHMFLERQLARDPTFPRATYIAGRRYWRLPSSSCAARISASSVTGSRVRYCSRSLLFTASGTS